MTEQEREELKAKLIELGFWDADDPGDPTIEHQCSQALHLSLENKLATDLFLSAANFTGDSAISRVEVIHGANNYLLATAGNTTEAMCLAALALPEFLLQHPECAAE